MTDHTVTLLLNQQQLMLIDNTVVLGAAPDRVSLVKRALHERGLPAQVRPLPVVPDISGQDASRELLDERVIEPGTGKALELLRGQFLRIEQIEGGQCLDFNCFNLHDY